MQSLPSSGVPSGPSGSSANLARLIEEGYDAIASLPLASGQPALTLADAIAKAQLQQEEKRKRDLAKDKQKTKSHIAVQDKFHGAIPGADEDKSAYWMFVEVRAICRSDLTLRPL